MDHVSLDGAGADNGHLDDQIIEGPRFQPGQHGHLGPAFHLEDPDGIGLAQHVKDLRNLLGHVGNVGDHRPVRQGGQHGEALA